MKLYKNVKIYLRKTHFFGISIKIMKIIASQKKFFILLFIIFLFCLLIFKTFLPSAKTIKTLTIEAIEYQNLVSNSTQAFQIKQHGLSHLPSENKFHIFLIWVGKSFPYLKAFETLLYHHRTSEILVFSNELNENIFEKYKSIGWDIKVVRFNLTKLAQNKHGFDFVLKARKVLAQKDPNGLQVLNTHISDFLRYFLLYYYGGLYLDTDMFVLRNLENLGNAIGVDVNNSYVCHNKSYSYGDVKNFSCLCNCMMSFQKDHPFLKEALEYYENYWSKFQGYGPGGAILLINLVERYHNSINFYDNQEFVCNMNIQFKDKEMSGNEIVLKNTFKKCYVYHVYGSGLDTFNTKLFDLKIIGHIYRKYKIKDSDLSFINKN